MCIRVTLCFLFRVYWMCSFLDVPQCLPFHDSPSLPRNFFLAFSFFWTVLRSVVSG